MADLLYSKEELFELGQSNYDKLVSYCETLDSNGFWDRAREVMQKSSTEVLDIYVQSVLMNLAVQCGNILESQKKYMCIITQTNPLGISEDEEITEDTISDSRRMYELPPILLQLCGLYDKEKSEDMTEMFLDALLNVLLCMAYLNDGKSQRVNEFIQEYYDKISNFITTRTQSDNEIYINKKLKSGRIECDVEWLHEEQKKKAVVRENITLAVSNSAKLKSSSKERVKKKVKKENIKKEVIKEKDIKENYDVEDERKYLNDEDTNEKDINENHDSEKSEEIKINKHPGSEDAKGIDINKHPDSKATKEINVKYAGDEEKQRKLEEFRQRTIEHQKREEEQAREQFQIVKKRLKDRERAEREEHERRIKELMDELNSLVGLKEVKEEVQSLINLIKIRKLREKMDMPTMEMTYHMVFTGSPGTGKTTVARIVGKIYKELGILSDGKMIETDRSGLVAGYVGQTAIKVHEIVEEAIGGVLFIDEAYSLVNPNVPNDFGTEAVDTLVKLMEDHRDNLVIIVAGYTEEMKTFLKSNSGLISRFNKFIDFPDYSREELVDIMDKMAEKTGLTIESDARSKVMDVLNSMSDNELNNFGNARGIRNLFEKLVTNQANRLVTIKEPTREQLMTIVADDVCNV
ncbi:MAG: AAA family ATPase [Lachnospiraceae bacterium]|nr:AAA family ATPase [Lachnospiraceae bacterium]